MGRPRKTTYKAPKPKNPKVGVDWKIEEQAKEWLKSTKTKEEIRSCDFLFDDQISRRKQREVYNKYGIPDSTIVSGIFNRAFNPKMGLRKQNHDED